MFDKFNLAAGICALLLFAFVQQQGWNLFENEASSSHGGSGSSRSYHK
ncbi:MAG: hypothetical protein HXL68_16045 [Dechloromonas agitata]|uniref:Uncharacterized protein n=1 Tax=Dechloromonas agitata TaxID=73030 RepID=A0A930BV80_9RHOO|nr:hypothetical protein [Dechloromonas agitata]MBF1166535.1 hypothetical protein [Dechloromonas agitata]